MSSYYVSPTGADTNPGTQASPFLTLAWSARLAVPGDTINLMSGVHTGGTHLDWKPRLNIVGLSGSVINSTGQNYGLKISNSERITLTDIVVSGSAASAGILLDNVTSGLVSGVTVTGASGDAIAITKSPQTRILRGTFKNSNRAGINCGSSSHSLTIATNTITDNSGAGILIDARDYAISRQFPALYGYCYDSSIYNNVISGNCSTSGAAIHMAQVKRCVIKNNLVYSNLGSGVIFTDNNLGAASGSVDNQVIHNTIVFQNASGSVGIYLGPGCIRNQIVDNIVVRPGTTKSALELHNSVSGYLYSDYNCFYGTSGQVVSGMTLAAWKSFSGLDNHSIYADPLLTAQYTLNSNSPCIDIGLPLINADYTELSRPQGVGHDIGCYEYEVTPVDPPAQTIQPRSTFGNVTFARAIFVSSVSQDDNLPPVDEVNPGLESFPCALLLGVVHVTPSNSIGNLIIVDSRSRGGGIPERYSLEDKDIPESTKQIMETYWDIGDTDGYPVPLAGSLIVQLPKGLTNGDSNYYQFTDKELRDIVERYVPAGVYSIIEYV